MLIYDKKSDAIDLYTIEEDSRKIKRYKKEVLQRNKGANLFLSLKTNNERTINEFNGSTDIEYCSLNYDDSTPTNLGYYSQIYQSNKQDDILEQYIEGYYDSIIPKRVYTYSKEDGLDHELFHLLALEEVRKAYPTLRGSEYSIQNMLNLPTTLYLLQLLQLGKYENLASRDISRLLELFNIEYLKSVKLSEIEEVLATGLVNGSMEEVLKKAETSSLILRKVRKRQE